MFLGWGLEWEMVFEHTHHNQKIIERFFPPFKPRAELAHLSAAVCVMHEKRMKKGEKDGQASP